MHFTCTQVPRLATNFKANFKANKRLTTAIRSNPHLCQTTAQCENGDPTLNALNICT